LRLHSNKMKDDTYMQDNLQKLNYEIVTADNAFWWIKK